MRSQVKDFYYLTDVYLIVIAVSSINNNSLIKKLKVIDCTDKYHKKCYKKGTELLCVFSEDDRKLYY
jgi:hypothetical protein